MPKKNAFSQSTIIYFGIIYEKPRSNFLNIARFRDIYKSGKLFFSNTF